MKVIGLTGTLSCGKGTVAAFLTQELDARMLVFSDVLRAELRRQKKQITRDELHDLANNWRKTFGPEIIARKLVELINEDDKHELFVCDGFRTLGEINEFRKAFGKNFVLISVDAPTEKRFQLSKLRAREHPPQTLEAFIESEKKETNPNARDFEQNLPACIREAKYNISNDGTPEDLRKKTVELVKKIIS